MVRYAAIERHLITLGEALVRVKSDAPDILEASPDFNYAIQMRNFLVHAYDRVDPSVLAATLRYDLPRLIEAIDALLPSGSQSQAQTEAPLEGVE